MQQDPLKALDRAIEAAEEQMHIARLYPFDLASPVLIQRQLDDLHELRCALEKKQASRLKSLLQQLLGEKR